ncbi:MAG: C39 family peptidase [Patescibacteria group bacterium]
MPMLSPIFLFSFFVTGTLLTTSSHSAYPTEMPVTFTSFIHHAEPTITKLSDPPAKKILPSLTFTMQSYNNCGPASLSMTLSHYGLSISQEILADSLRPHRNGFGIDDDKSTTLEEMAEEAKKYDLRPYHRPNGTLTQMKQFIAHGMPIITKEWLNETEDIGHYRLLRGYDDITQEIIQDDSYEGKDLRFSYPLFDKLWEKYNYEYLVLVPKEKQHIAEMILGEDNDPKVAWQHAAEKAEKKFTENPNDVASGFNLVAASYELGNYEKAVKVFEQIESLLPRRALWYQIEPIQAYFELGNYERVFALSDAIINDTNPAVTELYVLRGEIYKKQGNIEEARAEFEKAVYYNKNVKEAQEALKATY